MVTQIRYRWIVLFLALILPFVSTANAQAPKCKPINTAYHFLASSWRWTSPDSVVFSVNQGLLESGATPSPVAWYQYQPSADRLQQLDASPFDLSDIPAEKLVKLRDIQPWANGLYERVYVSPGGNKIIYLRKGPSAVTYWFLDLETNVEADLGAAPLGDLPTDVFWLPGEQQFIFQNGSNSLTPVLWVTEADGKLTITHMADLPPWTTAQQSLIDFAVAGLSPDGHYLLIQPQPAGLWIYDLQNKTLATHDLILWGDQHAIWEDASTFEAITALGVVEYNIQTHTQKVIAGPDDIELKNTGSSTTLSPDGKFMLTPRVVQPGPDQKLEVCALS